jgi:putative heme-binding domain-containing protein
MGMPWHRPTRITHAVNSSEFGWRSGSGKWPAYFEDSLPPLLDIGPGSPTGLITGAGAKFPAKYQHALYALDWTFGTIHAVHLTPKGSSYTATTEEFLTGNPLPLTSAVIGADGAMYFVTGGRGTQSGLYRISYRGSESTAAAPNAPDTAETKAARALRRALEAFHHQENPAAIEAAWPHLDSADRFLRFAARIAIESQPAATWAQRALTDPRPQARATAIIALARSGTADHRAAAITALLESQPSTPEARLATLRAFALVFIRLGEPDDAERQRVADHLFPQLPSGDDRIDTELIRLLVYLKDTRVIEPALALMLDGRPQPVPDWGALIQRNSRYGGTIAKMLENHPPTRSIDIALMLSNLRRGWTLDQRRAYFQFIIKAATYPGGASYTGFLKMIREAALQNTGEAERAALADITGETLDAPPPIEIKPPQGPGRAWTLAEATTTVDGQLSKRNFDAGRNHFFATSCAACHRFDGQGGNIGPDLSTVRHKFSAADLLEAIVDPSAAISDQYGTFEIKLKSGTSHIGLAVDRDDSYLIHTTAIGAEPITVAKADVASITQLPVSQMPPGLVNTLNPDELRDLIAYLLSGGDPEHAMFR